MSSVSETRRQSLWFSLMSSLSLITTIVSAFGFHQWIYAAFLSINLLAICYLREALWASNADDVSGALRRFHDSPSWIYLFGSLSRDKKEVRVSLHKLFQINGSARSLWIIAVSAIWFALWKYVFIFDYGMSTSAHYIVASVLATLLVASYHKNGQFLYLWLSALYAFITLLNSETETCLFQSFSLMFTLWAFTIYKTQGFNENFRFRFLGSAVVSALLIAFVTYISFSLMTRASKKAGDSPQRSTLRERVSRGIAEQAVKWLPMGESSVERPQWLEQDLASMTSKTLSSRQEVVRAKSKFNRGSTEIQLSSEQRKQLESLISRNSARLSARWKPTITGSDQLKQSSSGGYMGLTAKSQPAQTGLKHDISEDSFLPEALGAEHLIEALKPAQDKYAYEQIIHAQEEAIRAEKVDQQTVRKLQARLDRIKKVFPYEGGSRKEQLQEKLNQNEAEYEQIKRIGQQLKRHKEELDPDVLKKLSVKMNQLKDREQSLKEELTKALKEKATRVSKSKQAFAKDAFDRDEEVGESDSGPLEKKELGGHSSRTSVSNSITPYESKPSRRERLKQRLEDLQQKVDDFFSLVGSILKLVAIMFIIFLGYQIYLLAKETKPEEVMRKPEAMTESEKTVLQNEYEQLLTKPLSVKEEIAQTYQLFLKAMQMINKPKEQWRPPVSFLNRLIEDEFVMIEPTSKITKAYCDAEYGDREIDEKVMSELRQAREAFVRALIY